ncbi:uncharacterized protein C17orf53 homolog isoform X2 [Denticeps clupeoides]|uniref:uncharacterized protein C17orf53 homolog isoform X2 n=1 Tax=Denticeps clupeoides TaxID=299321 RepID=UPI0010A5180C|nr:uncharacterized protein C17orf53 homolog isoform X2 [Denticeps clupeoides]
MGIDVHGIQIETMAGRWTGLFGAGEDLDEVLSDADWTVTVEPESVPGAASHVRTDSLRPPSTSGPNPDALASASEGLAGPSNPVPPLGSSEELLRQPAGPPSSTVLPSEEFDDWDVDLADLDEMESEAGISSSFKSALKRPAEVTMPSLAKHLRPSVGAHGPPSTPISRFRAPAPRASFSSPRNTPVPACSPATPRMVRSTSQGTPWPRGGSSAPLFQTIPPALSLRPLNTPLLTNHLVQLVSASKKGPRSPRPHLPVPKTRRFPGPAGLLPQQLCGQSLDEVVVSVPQTPAHGAVARLRSEIPSSQGSEEEEFNGGAWAAMKAEMGLDERNPSCFLHSYSVVMVLRKAALRQLTHNKVPNMAVVLKRLLHTHADAKAVFKDPTGEIQGTVHRCLLEERQVDLKPGAVLLLKQVGVFSPSHRNHYLNITPNNLLRIYPPDGSLQSSKPLSQHSLASRAEEVPVSNMELLFEEEAEETAEISTPQENQDKESKEESVWDADDLDDLLGELPVEIYT